MFLLRAIAAARERKATHAKQLEKALANALEMQCGFSLGPQAIQNAFQTAPHHSLFSQLSLSLRQTADGMRHATRSQRPMRNLAECVACALRGASSSPVPTSLPARPHHSYRPTTVLSMRGRIGNSIARRPGLPQASRPWARLPAQRSLQGLWLRTRSTLHPESGLRQLRHPSHVSALNSRLPHGAKDKRHAEHNHQPLPDEVEAEAPKWPGPQDEIHDRPTASARPRIPKPSTQERKKNQPAHGHFRPKSRSSNRGPENGRPNPGHINFPSEPWACPLFGHRFDHHVLV